MHEIKSNQQNDIQTFFAKENVHIKTVESMSSQMASLKQAIGTLADVVSEEIEHLRKVVINGDMEQKIIQTNVKLEHLGNLFVQRDNEQSGMRVELEQLRDEISTLRAVESRKIDLTCAQIEEKITQAKTETK